MKREIIALAVLLIIPVAAYLNVSYFTNSVVSLIAEIDTAEIQTYAEDMAGAEKTVEESLQKWLSKKFYVHVFMTHDSLVGATDSYYILLSEIQSGDAQPAHFETLRGNLRSLTEIEHFKLSSLF